MRRTIIGTGRVSALLPLFAALFLSQVRDGWPWTVCTAVFLAAVAGTTFPDLDLPLRFGHRSALFHSVLPIVLASHDRRFWPVAAGLGLGIGLHLSADLFPRDMRGFATVKIPLFGSIGRGASYLWIALNAGGALAWGAWTLGEIMPHRAALGTMGAVAGLGVVYFMRTDGGWWALALLGAVGGLAYRQGWS